MTTRTWTCLCESFKGSVIGEPKLAVYCRAARWRVRRCNWQYGHLQISRSSKAASIFSATNLRRDSSGKRARRAVAAHKRPSTMTPSSPRLERSSVFLIYSLWGGCARGSRSGFGLTFIRFVFVYRGGASVKPTCHIFVGSKGDTDLSFPELPQHDAFLLGAVSICLALSSHQK